LPPSSEDAGRRFRFLVRDTDTTFTSSFDTVVTSVGIESPKTPVRSPRANAFAQRWVRTARQECLDHLVIVSRRHLHAVLAEYVCHSNRARPHRGRQLDLPQPTTAPAEPGPIRRHHVLGGLIHHYERVARPDFSAPHPPPLARSHAHDARGHNSRHGLPPQRRRLTMSCNSPGPGQAHRPHPDAAMNERSNPRLIKRKMPRWHVKRDRHRHWPQPTGPPVTTILRT
jgi:hypothetical protein